MLVAFDVLAGDRDDLERLFRTLNERISFLMTGEIQLAWTTAPGGRFLCLEFSRPPAPALARLYDAFNHRGEDGDFYENFAQEPCRVLDIGCGTGSVTLRLADRGHQVTGVDPADGMLQVARMKDGQGRVDWV